MGGGGGECGVGGWRGGGGHGINLGRVLRCTLSGDTVLIFCRGHVGCVTGINLGRVSRCNVCVWGGGGGHGINLGRVSRCTVGGGGGGGESRY